MSTKPWRRRAGLGAGIFGFVMAVLISIDQFGAVLLLQGDPDVTMSQNCGLRRTLYDNSWRRWLICEPICRTINLWDESHCEDAKE